MSLAVNVLLVEALRVPKLAAYAIVLWFQMTYGFFVNRVWVFEARRSHGLWRQYFHWISGISLFRAADWTVYTVLVTVVGVNYVAAQVVDSLLFTLLKFAFARRLFEGAGRPR